MSFSSFNNFHIITENVRRKVNYSYLISLVLAEGHKFSTHTQS